MSRIRKALRKWVYGTDKEDPFRAEVGKTLEPRYGINGRKPTALLMHERMKDFIEETGKKKEGKNMEQSSDLKLINRVSENGNMISEHLSIEPPKDLTIQWDHKEYEMVSITPGAIVLKRREGNEDHN